MTKVKSIYVNLPVKDLAVSRAFWASLGFTFNEQYSDKKALCMVLNDGVIYAMLIQHDFFATFTNRPIANSTTTQVLMAIEVDSKQQVADLVTTALQNGATRYREATDHGWMFYDSFADPDGHQWEILFTDYTQIPQQ